MRSRTQILAALALLTLGCRTTTPAARELDALFSDLHQRGLFQGAVVVRHDRVAFEKGYGYANHAKQVRFTPDTPADGGSLAKTFTAALVIAMHVKGQLDLDAPAQRLLPELPWPDVTLRHLLSHSSGLHIDYDYFDPWLPAGQIRTTEALLRVLSEQKPPLASPPGTAYEYNSLGFDLAALAASRAGGKGYVELLRERFFGPLGMTSTFARPGRLADFPGVRTVGYKDARPESDLNEVFDFEAFHGGSNLYLSARDLDRWNRSFLRAPLLDGAALDQALQFATIAGAPSGLTLGSWYRTDDGSAFWYPGHLQGFHSEVFRDLNARSSIVYVSNNTIEPWLQKGIVRAVAAILKGGSPASPIEPATESIPREARGSLAGRWRMPAGKTFVIVSSGDHIFAVHHGIRYRIVQIAPRWFYVPGLDHVLGFAESGRRIYVSSNVGEEWGSLTSSSSAR